MRARGVAVLCLASGGLACQGGLTDTTSAPVERAGAAGGELSPLIPVPKDAIHAGVSWTKNNEPKICFGMRPAEYRGFDIATEDSELRPIFQQLVYGGFGFSEGAHGLDQATARSDLSRDNFVCWDLDHPDAFSDTGVMSILDEDGHPLVDKHDFELTEDAFSDAGHEGGLNYNIFCAGNVALRDGRWLFVGGHDKSGNNGIRKLNIFDPATETWADRGMPVVKEEFLDDPTGTEYVHADAKIEENTDPPHPSDMKYQRWYPTAVALPDGDVLIMNGTDQDTSLGTPATQFFPACQTRDESAACSKVRVAVPEVYDLETDRTIALESAQKLHNMYARSFVVQTGEGPDDWKVAVVGEVHESSLVDGTFHAPMRVVGQFDPWAYTGRTHFLDVNAARADEDRDVPGENHWEYVAAAKIAHDSGASTQLWKLDERGHAVYQRVALFGGSCGSVPDGDDGEPIYECPEDTVEMIDFEATNPQWIEQEPLVQPATQNNAVALPSGDVLIVGGTIGRGPWESTMVLQMFEPDKGHTRAVHDIFVPHHDHSTLALLPDGRVMIMGGNATDLAGDVDHTHSAIPVAQIYSPSYLFRGPRPEVREAPQEIDYGERFEVEVDSAQRIGSVVLIRPGPVTHNWDWGNRKVELWFDEESPDELSVQAPAVPGLAVPGYYMLFVVNEAGVPAEAKLVHLGGGN